MPPPNIESIFSNIVEELENMKNLYSYSNNNEFYNSVIDMCIGKVLKVKESKYPEKVNNINGEPGKS
jgi:hypothetical protein